MLSKIITNSRFRRDILALQKTKKIFTYWAWEILFREGIWQDIQRWQTISEVLKKNKIKNKELFLNIINLLVSANSIRKENNKIMAIKKPKMPKYADYQYLLQTCPGSTKWAFALKKYSAESLHTGSKIIDLDFENAAHIWDLMMRESVDTLRAFAIEDSLKNIKKSQIDILVVGAGNGRDIEQIIASTPKRLNIDAIDVSNASIRTISELKKVLDVPEFSRVIIRPIKADILDFTPTKKYDFIILSLVLHHLTKEERDTVYKKLSKIKKDKGIVAILQIVHKRKQPNFIWVMHLLPTHRGYPKEKEFEQELTKYFKVRKKYGGYVWICT